MGSSKDRRRARRKARVRKTSQGIDLPIMGPSCVYVVIPTIPLKGKLGLTPTQIGDFMQTQLESRFADGNLLVKGVAVKVSRSAAVPKLMKEDLEHLQEHTLEIEKQYRSWSWKWRDWGFQFSIGSFSKSGEVEIYEEPRPEGKRADEPAARSSQKPAGRPRGPTLKSTSIN